MGTLPHLWSCSSNWSHGKKILSYVDKPVPVALCLPCVLCVLWRERLCPLPSCPLNIGTLGWVFLSLPGSSLLQGEKIDLLHSFLTEQVLQPFGHLHAFPLDPLQFVSALNCRARTGHRLQVKPGMCWVEWDDHIFTSASNTPVDTSQNFTHLFLLWQCAADSNIWCVISNNIKMDMIA